MSTIYVFNAELSTMDTLASTDKLLVYDASSARSVTTTPSTGVSAAEAAMAEAERFLKEAQEALRKADVERREALVADAVKAARVKAERESKLHQAFGKDSDWTFGVVIKAKVRFPSPYGRTYNYVFTKVGTNEWVSSAQQHAGKVVTFAEAFEKIANDAMFINRYTCGESTMSKFAAVG
jgi:hypothetical protein